ncbi:cell wall-active antibiotic response 4TMS protein YvqF [Mucilaginibacter oryzae]|uniref:Cell wall-active antibiotic response 4TMS protein YvqF n=1 Tax=Mucilaginibacter oryzae TaxID=468058 RepID=A0A316HJV2_9SPHI|nr:LiaF domain-containing protein [Mucilaginibacter oryzae]PWK80320.1 cell wall-active antibiotic response 4TMS protein YvqF [Mucilaginibacter oryzae]
MNNDIEHKDPNKRKTVAGIILLAVGGFLLLQQFRIFFIPDGLKLWPVWLLFWGWYVGAKHNYKKSSWMLLVGLGVVFLITENIHDSGRIVGPLAVIGFGMWLILRRNKHFDPQNWKNEFKTNDWDKWGKKQPFQFDKNEPVVDYTVKDENTDVPPVDPYTQKQDDFNSKYSGDDYIDTVSIFGGVNKAILSKKFRGGDIVNIFGGAELDFTQADINGRVVIDITQIFGGTKIIVPSNWQVVSDLAAVFASVDDKRIRSTASVGSEKVLVLTGVSIFAGVDIRSY